jgi:hypothetical protein
MGTRHSYKIRYVGSVRRAPFNACGICAGAHRSHKAMYVRFDFAWTGAANSLGAEKSEAESESALPDGHGHHGHPHRQGGAGAV